MKRNSIYCPTVVTCLLLALLCGCPQQNGNGNGDENEMRFDLPLSMLVAPVEVQAGETTTFRQSFDLVGLMGPLDSVTVDMAATLESVDITMLDDGTGKSAAAAQGTPSLVTYRVGGIAEAETVCETGVAYGPFTVTLGANDQPESVLPATSALTSASVEVINSGQFALCVQVVSPRRAMVAVGNLAVDVEMRAESGDCATPSNFSGNWHAEFICTNSCSAEGFGGEFDTIVTQVGDQASYNDGEATFSGRVCGNVFTFSASEGAGFVETGTLTLNTDGSATRQSHYRSNDTPNCEGDCQDTFTRTDGGGNGAAVCGNSVVETGEGCDDGNTVPGDGCNTCQLETGDCVPFGGQCTDDADCCDDFPCIDGVCI